MTNYKPIGDWYIRINGNEHGVEHVHGLRLWLAGQPGFGRGQIMKCQLDVATRLGQR